VPYAFLAETFQVRYDEVSNFMLFVLQQSSRSHLWVGHVVVGASVKGSTGS
jgi:hypothetical protein